MNTSFTSSHSIATFFSGKRFLLKPSEKFRQVSTNYSSTLAELFNDTVCRVTSDALEGANAFLEVRRPNGFDTFTSKINSPMQPVIGFDEGKEAVIVEFVPAKRKKGYNPQWLQQEGNQADVEKAENAFILRMARNKNLSMEILPDSPSQPN